MTDTDLMFIRRCCEIARLGAGRVSPNPMVGCVIVHDGRIIGEGWHEFYGGPHAEVNAVASVEDPSLLKASTLYVSLEPCSFHGKTPPCADLIIRHNIPRVVVAAVDPHEKVCGNGIARLKEQGVDVAVLEDPDMGMKVDPAFFAVHTKKRPFIRLKWAVSADGYIAPPAGRQWISNAFTKRLTHRWRMEMDAILIGHKTASLDNPALSDRFWGGPSPLRVIVDPRLALPDDLNIFRDGQPTLVLNTLKSGRDGKTEYVQLSGPVIEPVQIAKALLERGISSLLVEGGANTLQQFIDARCWDEAVCYRSGIHLGEGIPAPALKDAQLADRDRIADNVIETYLPA